MAKKGRTFAHPLGCFLGHSFVGDPLFTCLWVDILMNHKKQAEQAGTDNGYDASSFDDARGAVV